MPKTKYKRYSHNIYLSAEVRKYLEELMHYYEEDRSPLITRLIIEAYTKFKQKIVDKKLNNKSSREEFYQESEETK